MGFIASTLGQVGSAPTFSENTTGTTSGIRNSLLLPNPTLTPSVSTPGTVGAGATSLGSTTAASIAGAQAIGFNTPATPALPSWLSTDPNGLQKELADQYSTAGESIISGANKTGAVAAKDAQQAYGQNMREGQNATAQQTAVNRQQGGTAKTSSIVAGQMAEDAAKQKTDAKVQIAQMKLGATEQAASLSSQIAGQMASLRTSYLSSLASTSTAARGQDISQTDFAQSQAQQAAEFAASLQGTKTAGGTGSMTPNNGLPPGFSYSGLPGAGSGAYLGPAVTAGWGG